MPLIPVLILAAGQSRRMRGADKLLQDMGGQSLLARQIKMAAPIGPVHVALLPHCPARHHIVQTCNATPLAIADAHEGMGATLRSAVPQMPAGPFMLILGDLISLETSDLRAVLNAMLEHPDHLIWRGATPEGKAGHPIIFAATLRPEFARLQGDNGGEMFVKPLKSKTFLHHFHDNRARHDLDTPEDWDRWRELKK